jgi:hypothetical protein
VSVYDFNPPDSEDLGVAAIRRFYLDASSHDSRTIDILASLI